MEKIIILINKKIEFYKNDAIKCESLKVELRDKLIQGRQELEEKSPKVAETGMQILTLADRIRFNEICIKCLEDIKKDITGG